MRQRSVFDPRSSNRTCRSPASGSPTGFIARHTERLWPQASSARLLSLLRLTIELSLKDPDHSWCLQAHRANHLHLAIFESTPEVRVLSSAGVTRLQRSYDPVRLPPEPSPTRDVEAATSLTTGLPRLPASPFRRAVPTTRRIERVRVSITSSLVQPSPNGRRVGIRIVTFEACSGFTHVTARRIAQLPKATFFTRLQPVRLPARAARQLPDQSTTLRVDSSSTDDSRLRGAPPIGDICSAAAKRLGGLEVVTNSNLVGSMTGRSAALAPLRIFPA
jgi:hypothetical protein